MKNTLIIVLICLLFASLIFAQTIQNERVLKVGAEGDIHFLSPWDSTFAIRHKILWNIFETLIVLEEKSTKVKPHLATSWKASNNNRIWVFKLRQGVKFHDGSTLTADDVVASASLFSHFEGKVEKVDRFTVRFTLPEPNSGFLNRLVELRHAIASSKTIQQYKLLQKEGRLQEFVPIGSGPFKFSHYDKGKKISMNSFDDYWQGSPWLKKLIYQIIPDNKVRLAALEKGEIDVLDVLLPADLPQVNWNPRLKIESIYGMNICYLSMNTTRKPLDNINVRRAINLAIDKMKLASMFYYGGYGVPTNRIISPAFWGFSLLSSPGSYEPIKAKRMLVKAGYKHIVNSPLRLICIPNARPYLPDPKGMAEEIKRQLAEVGVKVNIIIPIDFAEYDFKIKKEDYDLVLAGWIEVTGDPDYTLTTLLTDRQAIYNDSRWHNKLFDKKLKAARELPHDDVKGRIRLYNEAQKIFQNEAPWVPLFHTKIFVIHNTKVKGIILYPSTMVSYHKVRFEK